MIHCTKDDYSSIVTSQIKTPAFYSQSYNVMAYGSKPYVGMAPPKNGGHIESAQMTCSKCLC